MFVHAAAHGGIALRIEVDQQNALAELCECRREIDRGGGFADAAFLVGHTEDFRHGRAFSCLWVISDDARGCFC